MGSMVYTINRRELYGGLIEGSAFFMAYHRVFLRLRVFYELTTQEGLWSSGLFYTEGPFETLKPHAPNPKSYEGISDDAGST